jgi:RNA polymerase sigma-70 factor (ECF subfamily)
MNVAPLEDDESLVRRAGAGDGDAFGALVQRLRGRVFRYARTLVRTDADAEDVLQRTFVAAWRGASGFEGRSTAFVWLCTIARHAAERAGRLRAGAPRRFEPLDSPELETLGCAAGFGDPEALTAELEEIARVRAALARLVEEDREILTLRDVEGLSGPEVEAVLGLSRAAMKSRLHRARLHLIAEMTREERTHGR